MMVDAGTTLRMFCFYTFGGVGRYGHDVTVDIKESGNMVLVDVAAVDEGDGWYHVDHTATTKCYPQATFKTIESNVDQKHIPALGFTMVEFEEAYDNFTATGYIVIGQGRGTETWTDTVTDGINPVAHVVVKAFWVDPLVGIDWSEIVAMDKTNHEGEYTLYLDPGDYVLSIERNATQLATMEITVT